MTAARAPSSSTGAAPSPAGTTSTSTPSRWRSPQAVVDADHDRPRRSGAAAGRGRRGLGAQPRPPAERDDRRPLRRGGARPRPGAAVGVPRVLGAAHLHRPGGRPAVGGLRGDGLKVGVLSNTVWPRAWHEEFFRRDGVLDLVDGDVYTSEIPWTKPSPKAFGAAMAAVGVADPARCVYVGDRLFDDIWGAAQRRHADHPRPAQRHPGRARSGTPRVSRTPSSHDLAEIPAIVRRWSCERLRNLAVEPRHPARPCGKVRSLVAGPVPARPPRAARTRGHSPCATTGLRRLGRQPPWASAALALVGAAGPRPGAVVAGEPRPASTADGHGHSDAAARGGYGPDTRAVIAEEQRAIAAAHRARSCGGKRGRPARPAAAHPGLRPRDGCRGRHRQRDRTSRSPSRSPS